MLACVNFEALQQLANNVAVGFKESLLACSSLLYKCLALVRSVTPSETVYTCAARSDNSAIAQRQVA